MVSGRILYATDIIPAVDICERVPRLMQSEAAGKLLSQLVGAQFRPNATSKSHSRAIFAAAAGHAEQLRLGIDVEWMCEDRRFDAIIHCFWPSLAPVVGSENFYRAWTFLEAYYKAFQKWPDAADVAAIISSDPDTPPRELGDGVRITQHRVADVFELCLVWKSSELCTVEYSPSAAIIDTPQCQT